MEVHWSIWSSVAIVFKSGCSVRKLSVREKNIISKTSPSTCFVVVFALPVFYLSEGFKTCLGLF